MQRVLIALGIALVLIGFAWPWLSKLPFGRLPGDIVVERDNFTVYLPLATMIVISVILSLVLWLFRR